MTICRICKENGFDNQEIKFHGKDADDKWIINNPDGSKHQHKKPGEEPLPAAATIHNGTKFVKLPEGQKQLGQQQHQSRNNNGNDNYWQKRPRVCDVQVVPVEQARTLLHMDKSLDMWGVVVANNQPLVILVAKEQQSQVLLPDSNTIPANESEKDQRILVLEERMRELEPLASKWVEHNSFKPAAELKEGAEPTS